MLYSRQQSSADGATVIGEHEKNSPVPSESHALMQAQRSQSALEQLNNGQLVDGEAVMTWIASWGSPAETEWHSEKSSVIRGVVFFHSLGI